MENNFLICAVLILISLSVTAQLPTCDCKSDLDFIVEKLRKTPSYQRQMTSIKLEDFNKSYSDISKTLSKPISIIECFAILRDQLTLIDDFHYNLYFNAVYDTSYLSQSPYSEDEVMSLREKLSAKSNDEFEGVYILGKEDLEIGITAIGDLMYEGVILSRNDSIWKLGEVYLTAEKNKFEKYNLLIYKPKKKQLQMLNNITFENGRLISLKKLGHTNNHEFKTNTTSNWELKTINENVQYMYLGNFSRRKDNRIQADNFLAELKDTRTASHIIVDLRSNSGGASKVSKPFFKFLKRSKAKLYVLTNSFSISNAEQFTANLKTLDKTTHLGQTTFGALAYGSNYGNLYTTPSGYFSFYPTDMDFHKKYFKFEGQGIIPELKLDFDRDWIEQTLEIIGNSE